MKEINLNNVEFDRFDLDCLHDVILSSTKKNIKTDEELMEYWKILPYDIKLDAMKWEISDTVVRDNMYVFFKENCK